MLKVLIADDHEIVRNGITQIIQEEFPDAIISEAVDTNSLVNQALENKWDIIVSDLSMPGGGGLSAITRIHEKLPRQRILIISVHSDEQYALNALKTGAYGYLPKDAAPEELNHAIQIILDGRRYIHPALGEKMTVALRKKAGLLPHEVLNERELDVMLRLASGFPVSEIARQLSLTVTTISNYCSRIIEKMDMKSNADLMRYVIEHKLI